MSPGPAGIADAKRRAAVALEIAKGLTRSDDRRFWQVKLEIDGAAADGGALALFASDNPEGIAAVVEGRVAMALVNPSVMLTLAYRGTGPFREPQPVRAIAVVPSYDLFAFVVTPDTGLTSLEDVRERRYPLRIALRGQRNHSLYPVLDCVLAAAGFSLDDVLRWGGSVHHEPGFDAPGKSGFNQPARLEMARNGTINAIFDEAVYRWLEDAQRIGMRALPLGAATVRNLVQLGFRANVIDKATYPLLDASSISLAGVLPATARAAADDLRLVHVLGVPTDGVKSVLYAERANLFRKRGIHADVVSMGSGAAIFAAVVGGSADVGSGSLFPVFAAYGRGLPLRIIAPASLYTSEHADAVLVVQKNSPIQSAHDLNGKIIGADAIKDVYSTATRAWVDQHGGDGSSLRPVELRPTEQVAALDTGRIDAVVLKSPYLQGALASGKFRVLAKPLDAIGTRFLLSCWVASADYIAKNAELVNSFVAALTEAARYTNANQAATVDLVAGFTGQDAATIGRGIRSITAETITLADLQRPLDFAVKYGIIEKSFDLSGLLAPSVPLVRSGPRP